jgi:uncharacterized membrane protein
MKPLIVLLAGFIISAVLFRMLSGDWNLSTSGNVAMCLMLCFTALGHFKFSKGMTAMLPGFVPFKKGVVIFTGFAEVAMGVALLFPALRHGIGILLIVFLVLVLPANIYTAVRHINYETGGSDGKGVGYLWFRVPMQVLFIAWVLYFSVNVF